MKKLRITNKADETPTIYIYDDIGPSWMGMVGADSMRLALDELKDKKRIQVRVNSPGGDVFEGQAIYNLLKDHPAEIEIMIDGYAASIASIIAMAGDDIVMAENAFLMIHNPWTVVGGESKDLRKTADVMDQIKDSLVGIYAKRSGVTAEELSQMMDDETWLNASDAKEMGMVTAISENQSIAAKFDPELYGFRNAPTQIEREQKQLEPSSGWKMKLRKRRLDLEEVA